MPRKSSKNNRSTSRSRSKKSAKKAFRVKLPSGLTVKCGEYHWTLDKASVAVVRSLRLEVIDCATIQASPAYKWLVSQVPELEQILPLVPGTDNPSLWKLLLDLYKVQNRLIELIWTTKNPFDKKDEQLEQCPVFSAACAYVGEYDQIKLLGVPKEARWAMTLRFHQPDKTKGNVTPAEQLLARLPFKETADGKVFKSRLVEKLLNHI
jgi:hypothetical protein